MGFAFWKFRANSYFIVEKKKEESIVRKKIAQILKNKMVLKYCLSSESMILMEQQ